MKKNGKLKDVPISGMGGIETWKDAAEFMALGCGTIQVTTAVMQYGYGIVSDMIDGMKRYLANNGIKNISEIIGRAIPKIVDAESLERSSISFPKFLHEKCVQCGRCVVSCSDGGHQALSLKNNTSSFPLLNAKKMCRLPLMCSSLSYRSYCKRCKGE